MKKIQMLALLVCFIFIALCGITDAGDKILVNENLPLPNDVKVIPPGKDVSKEIAAFSGVWEGKEGNFDATVFLVVEEINYKEAKVVYCKTEVPKLHMSANCFRHNAIVTPEKQQIEFGPNKRYWSTFNMENNLNQLNGTIKNPGFSDKIVMTKIK